jgi:hypothetical protein
LPEDIDAHDFMKNDAAVTDRIDELARDETGQRGFDIESGRERRDGGRRNGLAQYGERLHRDARRFIERGNRPRVLTEASARELATQTERHAARTPKGGIEAFDGAELFFEALPQRGRRIDIEAVQLELGNGGPDCSRKRIATDDNDATERGRAEQ